MTLKNRILRGVCAMLVICLALPTLCSCGVNEAKSESKAIFEDFFRAIKAEDYDKAEEYLHPDLPILAVMGQVLIIEERENIDFQSQIVIHRYPSFSSSYYDSSVDGSKRELTADATIGDVTVTMEIVIVDNDEGYGIYSFDVYER